jgi:hypothetical protein
MQIENVNTIGPKLFSVQQISTIEAGLEQGAKEAESCHRKYSFFGWKSDLQTGIEIFYQNFRPVLSSFAWI